MMEKPRAQNCHRKRITYNVQALVLAMEPEAAAQPIKGGTDPPPKFVPTETGIFGGQVTPIVLF